MVALSKKLQAQSPCLYQSEQLLPLYGYKKPKFLLGKMGPRVFLLLFSDRLLSKQGKWG